MIFETNISDYYKVVQSSDECCYKYILGKLQEAKEIYIMAFGKSQRNIQLMDSLKSLKGKITVISDIDTIKGENIKRINKINSSFNLDKNSKIIMTERAAFIGAEEGSFSTGFLTIDSDVVDELRDNLFTEKEEVYKGYEFTKIEIIFMNYYSKINRIIEDIISGAFKEDEKGNGFYNSNDAHIKSDDIKWVHKTIDEFNITLANIKEVELKKALEDTFDKENISALKQICISDGNMMKLANLSLDDVEKRKELSIKAEKEITELYDKLSIFNEELYGVVEQMIDIKTRQ